MSVSDDVAIFEKFKKEAEAKYLHLQPLIRPDVADFEERYTKRLVREGVVPNSRNTLSDTPVSEPRPTNSTADHLA